MNDPAPSRPVRARPGRVFVSSVFGGMLDVRRRVEEACAGLGFTPVMAEDLLAESTDVAGVLEREIARSDTYVGVFAHRQGTVPGGEKHAITEQEYLLARRHGLRCLAFYDASAEGEREPGLAAFLAEHVTPYRGGVYPRPYRTDDELRLGVAAALSMLRPRLTLWLGPAAPGDGLDGAAAHAGRLYLADMRPALPADPDMLGPFAVNLDLPDTDSAIFGKFLDSQARQTLMDSDLQSVGHQLAAGILPGDAGDAVARALDLCAEAGMPLLFTIRTRDPDALALPWELLSIGAHDLPVRDGRLVVARHIPADGDGPDPADDPGTAMPRRQFGVLGFTAEPLEDQAGDVGLGAEGLTESRLLFWDREQDILLQALDPVLVTGGGRLVLPDTGAASELRAELAAADRPGILHLSGHGGPIAADGGGRRHAIFLEDDEGHRLPATAADLLAWIDRPADVDLVCLSACYTAAARAGAGRPAGPGERMMAGDIRPDARTGSLAEDLIRGGVPRVLGMQTTISDGGAIAFAHAFYGALAEGGDVPAALRKGRLALREAPLAHEWAIPVLLTRAALGPLVAQPDDQEKAAAPLKTLRSQFDIGADQAGSVTYLAEGYVGRRQFERRLHAAWKAHERIIVIHGLGGIGKSTIAARFLERRTSDGDRVFVLPPGARIAATVLEEVAERVGVARRADLDPAAADEALHADLRAVLGAGPTIVLMDNFEDNQVQGADADGGAAAGADVDGGTAADVGALKDPALGPALVELARLGGAALQILVTSRYPLRLPAGSIDAFNLDLGALSPAEARKLKLTREGLRGLDEADWRRILFYLGGHPKALELLGDYLRTNARRLPTLMKNLEATLGRVDERLAAEAQLRGRRLLIDEVLRAVPAAHLPALDRLCLLVTPLPTPELVAILEADGIADALGQIEALRDRGLLAETVAPNAIEGGDAVHRLVASRRLGALADREGKAAAVAFHRRAAEHFQTPGRLLSDYEIAAHHLAQAGDPAGALGLYDLWAIALRDRHAYMAAAQVALQGMQEIGHDGSEAARVAEARLWTRVHDGLLPLGDVKAAAAALDRAEVVLAGLEGRDAVFMSAGTNMLKGRLLVTRGDVGGATVLLEKARTGFETSGANRETAIVLGDIARLRAQAGDVQGAMALHQEMLAIFEQLGDKRERAVTLGDIARLRARAGDVQGAMDLHQEMLAINRSLNDVDGIANAQFNLAQLDLSQQEHRSALERLAESWALLNQIGRIDGIAAVGSTLGQLLAAFKHPDAVPVLRRAEEAWRMLDQIENADAIKGIIRQIDAGAE